MRELIFRIVRAKISLPAFMWVLSSLTIASHILFKSNVVRMSPFGQDLPIDVLWWSILLIVGDATCFIGMVLKLTRVPLVRAGAMVSFCMWIFGSIALGIEHSWFVLLFLTIPYIINYAYLYLAGSVGLFRGGIHAKFEKLH